MLLLQRCNWGERAVLLTPDPIVAQLLTMEFRPVESQAQCATRQLALNDFQRIDAIFASYSPYIAWKCGGG
jgi:hypothetical protein